MCKTDGAFLNSVYVERACRTWLENYEERRTKALEEAAINYKKEEDASFSVRWNLSKSLTLDEWNNKINNTDFLFDVMDAAWAYKDRVHRNYDTIKELKLVAGKATGDNVFVTSDTFAYIAKYYNVW